MGKIQAARQWLRDAFDEPKTRGQMLVTLTSMFAVIGSILHIAFIAEHPQTVREYLATVDAIEWAFTVFFTVEIILRVFAKPRPSDYLTTRFGIIDVLAVMPTWLSLIMPGLPNLNWLRALRLIRLLQIIKVLRKNPEFATGKFGLLLQLAPFMAYAFILKTVIVVIEGSGYWPEIPGLALVISVIGFAIGVLLSTRLGTVQGRLYDFENSIASLAAAVRVIREAVPQPALLGDFLRSVVRFSEGQCKQDEPQELLEEIAAAGPGSVGPPVWINFHQHAQFIVQRLGLSGVTEYNRVLKNVIVIYIVAVLMVIPGLTGLISAALVVYVLGGMFMLIQNMERPYSPEPDTLINADMEPLYRIANQLSR